MKWLLTSILLIISAYGGSAQTIPDTLAASDTITCRVVLIGDAGELVGGRQPVVDGVRTFIPLDKKTTVLYLGDNIYGAGLPDDQYSYYGQYQAVLDTQVGLVNNTPAHAYFIPGNHDWENGKPGGYAAVMRQQRYIDRIARENVKFYPKDGCPGPVAVDISPEVVLVMMDSQWWLHPNDKPGIESDCPQKTKEQVIVELEDILSKNDKKLILFACHHPFKSNGIHGGYYTIKQHIFPFTDINKKLYIPLPVIGSIYPISRSVFGSPQDVKHPAYVDMIDEVTAVLKDHPHVIYLAGHEHNMQYIQDNSINYIISGAGCKHSRVQPGRGSEFVTSTLGFATLEISKAKNVKLSFYTVAADSLGLAFRKNILNYSTHPKPQDTIARTVPIYHYKDSVLAPASVQYEHTSDLKKFILGYNYREVWGTPVMFKEFQLLKEKGGFTIEGRGGGKQTKTLTLKDKNGDEWALRTIDKDPAQAIPPNLRNEVTKSIIQDMISASHPYAPLIVPPLARSVDVLQASPEFYFVPDDPAFGFYRELFANKICMLERKDPVPRGVDTKSTLKVISSMTEESDHLVDQHSVLRARMLDIVIGDWDRHLDQWKWAVLDTGVGKLYEPIAKDRDQAMFYSNGVALKMASMRKLPFLKGFVYNIPQVNWLGFSARDFDRLFLNGLEKKDWQNTLVEFKKNMTDSVIDLAVRKLPRDIYTITGDTIAAKLKSRRDHLYTAGMRYYRFLARRVNILGSNKQEYFDLSGNDSGLLVKVYAREKYGDTNLIVYQRQFDPRITKEIRLYGFNGNDRFHVERSAAKGIRVRLIGGKGLDTFDAQGRLKAIVYDLSTEHNYIVKGSRTKDRMSADPETNAFSILEYQYDIKRLPKVNLGFNSEDGLMVGLGFWLRTYGFRKKPYESDNKLSTLYSLYDKAYNIRYKGEFNSVFRQYDILIHSDYYNPTLNNFFGLGNETKKLAGYGLYYYRARYKYFEADAQVRKRFFGNKVGVSVGPYFYHYWNREADNKGRILEDIAGNGTDSNGVFGIKSYLGGRMNLEVNNLNNEFYPTRGVYWNTELKYLSGLNANSRSLTRLQSDMTIYASLADPSKLLAVLRFGGGHIFSSDYEYFQALNIGANNYLRGFRKNRFSGSSLAYASVELRYNVVELKSYVLPGTFGILGFNDVGRVWESHETSHRWHNAYGGGVYYLPFNLFIVSATAGLSSEGTLFNFTLGSNLNLYF
jgi:hypothetical protein